MIFFRKNKMTWVPCEMKMDKQWKVKVPEGSQIFKLNIIHFLIRFRPGGSLA